HELRPLVDRADAPELADVPVAREAEALELRADAAVEDDDASFTPAPSEGRVGAHGLQTVANDSTSEYLPGLAMATAPAAARALAGRLSAGGRRIQDHFDQLGLAVSLLWVVPFFLVPFG